MAVITKGGGGVVVEAETADATREKAERRGYFVLEVNRLEEAPARMPEIVRSEVRGASLL